MEIDEKVKKALKYAENSIKKRLGSLEDLPPELANTVCNIYLRLCLLGVTDPVEIAGSGVMHDIQRIVKHIDNLREIDKNKKPNEYNYVVQFILDCLKYKIENAHMKSGLRRSLERKIRKKNVDEIQKLVDLMDVY